MCSVAKELTKLIQDLCGTEQVKIKDLAQLPHCVFLVALVIKLSTYPVEFLFTDSESHLFPLMKGGGVVRKPI